MSTPDQTGVSGRIVVPRWVQLAVLPVLLLVLWFAVGALEQAVFIFLVAGFIALVLNPLVRLLGRVRIPRFIAVFLVYVAFVAAVALIVVIIWPPFLNQMNNLVDNLPGMGADVGSGIQSLQNLADRYNLDVDVEQALRDLAAEASKRIPAAGQGLLGFGVEVARFITVAFVIVVISIYMLLDGRRIGRFIAGHFPTGLQDGELYVARAQDAVVDYVKAQVLLSAALGASVSLVMYILGVTGVFPNGSKYALFFGVWTAFMEAIPYIGPVLAAVPPTLVALFHAPITALWVIVVFILIQQVEGHILVPVIMGSRFRVHPLIVIFAILAGGEIHGVVGMLLAIPMIPLVKETILFLRPRVHFERWGQTARETVVEALTPAPAPSEGSGRSEEPPAAPAPGADT